MNALTTTAPQHSQPTVLRPQSMTELLAFAQVAAKSSMMPRDYLGKPENIVIAVQMGSELGLAPMQAIQNIAVINGKPSVYGDAMLGLVLQSPLCEDVQERTEGAGDKLTAICVAKRAGKKPVERSFSVDDAKKANLWGKAGPWQQYPQRMLQMRARGFALRDAFADVLRGLISAEEASDIPTIEAVAEPAPTKTEIKPHPMMPTGPVDPNPVDITQPPQVEKRSWAQWAEALEIAERDTPDSGIGLLLAKAETNEIYRLAKEGKSSPAKQRILDVMHRLEERYLADPPEPSEEEAPAIKGEEYASAG